MSFLNSVTVILLLLACLCPAFADEPSASEQGGDAARKESAARLTVMRRRAMSVTVEAEVIAGKLAQVKIIATPLLRYSNQAAQIITADATVWAWGETGRPMALASLEETGLEIVSLAEMPASLTGKSGLKWSSAKSEISWNVVPAAPVPGNSPILRARQMKEISKRFSAMGHYGADSGNQQLRLLERYLHRYSDLDDGIMDGAIYAFAAGTNPEVIVLIECRESRGKGPQWFYGVTRLSAGSLDAKLDDREVWSCPAISSWNARDPYWSSRFGKEDIVPESELPPAELP